MPCAASTASTSEKSRRLLVWDVIANNWPPVLAALSLVGTVGLSLLGKTYAKREETQALNGEMTAVQQRLAHLEAKVSDLPGHNELAALRLEVSELRGDLKEIRPVLSRLERLSDLLLENELKEKS
ncbi:hypothetical protein AN401_11655 [Zobellella denitrificans]|uniref:DUF2730 domain-containing protein n=1 Tax=Zobellella denitrificans TaxID=347534 RepID=A0A291HQR7_9GAMM|nr:hypothetical protein AN401_11085 [Zobellella denitrificans]ATG74428.1 hypothetical protein AN401_11655 [Zobellella denitrificans]